MPYYAHTANHPDGTRDLDESKWQPLHVHLRNVAEHAAKFAASFDASGEARLAGLLHDLGKYAARFQARLRDPRIHGINHWANKAAQPTGRAADFLLYIFRKHIFQSTPLRGEEQLLFGFRFV